MSETILDKLQALEDKIFVATGKKIFVSIEEGDTIRQARHILTRLAEEAVD